MKKILIVGGGRPIETALHFALGGRGEYASIGSALRMADRGDFSIAVCSYGLRHQPSVVKIAGQIPTLYISTAHVFSGPGPHKEWDPVAPLSEVCRVIAETEQAVRIRGGCVLRVGTILDQLLLDDLLSEWPAATGRPRIPNIRLSVSYPPFVAQDIVHVLQNWTSYIGRVVHSVCWPGVTMPELYDTVNGIYGRQSTAMVEPITKDERSLGFPIDSRLSNTFLPNSRHVIDAIVATKKEDVE